MRQTASRGMAEDTGARRYHTKPAQLPRRRSFSGRNEGMNDWVKAGLLLVGIVVAVIIAVHFIGGSSTPSSTNNGNPPQGIPGGGQEIQNPGSGQPVIITPSGGG